MGLKGNRFVVERGDSRYPKSLETVQGPPEKLYVIGDVDALQPGLGVIGARKATPYGIGCAKRFAKIAAEKGICIVSGGARGCDSAAHAAALEAGGKTVVFLGGGCDQIYPAGNFNLFQRVVEGGGAIVSEHPWGQNPLPAFFRMRNRLIAGLSRAVLIVEAGMPSGTFSTADDALDLGKDVLVVPGSITSNTSRGSNRLLLQGAIPIVDDESFEDALFNSFGMLKRPDSEVVDGALDDPVLAAAVSEPLTIDELYEVSRKWSRGRNPRDALMESLARGEFLGIVARYPDGKWGPAIGKS